jgi:mono/diheme cytochrome c family protein
VRSKNAALAIAVVVAALYGCYTGPDSSLVAPPAEPGGAPMQAGGLPCDVADLLAKRCASCHGARPSAGARSSLVVRDALAAPWDGASSLAQTSLDRMRDRAAPMPPEGVLAGAEIDVLARWIAQGMPSGRCGDVDAGGPVQLTCTSGTFWTEDDDEGSKLMTPGRACIACHALANRREGKPKDDDDDDDDDEAPAFTAAGTLYPTLHEPEDCFGVGNGAQVIVEGADGKVLALAVNRAGNFMTEAPMALPYRVKVVRAGKELVMKAPATSGDCNACHTSIGASEAAGRVLSP